MSDTYPYILLALVAVVAVIGLFVTFSGSSDDQSFVHMTVDSEVSTGDLSGEAWARFGGSQGVMDSDGGKNYDRKGMCRSARNNFEKEYDTCIGPTNLIELFPSTYNDGSGICGSEVYACPNGCEDGACVNENQEKQCWQYTYNDCPTKCTKTCIPSSCSDDGYCTADCDGQGSCR